MHKLADFKCIGTEGLGNPRSKNAHSMAFFNGRLYLGITHHNAEGPEDSARIMCYDPARGEWEERFRSPLRPADERANAKHVFLLGNSKDEITGEVPVYRGYRGMAVFKGKSDSKPALYIGTISHWGAQILRSTDGQEFTPVCEPGLGNLGALSFRALIPFKNKLFIAPTGSISGEAMDRNFGEDVTLYVSADPAKGKWQPAMQTSFGDTGNRAIFGMTVFGDHLYAGTGNPDSGFQIWRTTAQGTPPYAWEPVIRFGAYRYNLNEVASSMMVFKGALYVGTGIPGIGYDKANDVGPSAAELIRIHADGSWDLIVGSPRFTPDGFKVPLSAHGPGFDDADNTVFWSMGVHRDSLYIGTNQVTPWKIALRGDPTMRGGAQFWATDDGEDWQPVTLDAFGNHYACGIRTMCSTPEGFYVGTSNHQEIDGLWRRRTRKSGSAGAGGLDVWFAATPA